MTQEKIRKCYSKIDPQKFKKKSSHKHYLKLTQKRYSKCPTTVPKYWPINFNQKMNLKRLSKSDPQTLFKIEPQALLKNDLQTLIQIDQLYLLEIDQQKLFKIDSQMLL